MDEARQKHAIDALLDWSKWVIGLGFTAGAGCVVIFRDAAEGPARDLLMLAIAAFALSVLVAVVLVRALAATVERLPLAWADGEPQSVRDHVAGRFLSIGWLSTLQLALVVVGAGCLLGWVVLLPT